MNERTPHVKVRVLTRRDAGPQKLSPRESFWREVQQDSSLNRITDRDPDRLERMLLRELPGRLSHLLIASVGAPLENAARLLNEQDERYGWRELEHLIMRRSKLEDAYSFGDFTTALAQLAEVRSRRLRDVPDYSKILERVSAASQVGFSARILSYSSLEFGLSIGNLKALARAFDSDFESFQVFLDAFVPEAFDYVFFGSDGPGYEWSVAPAPALSDAFREAIAEPRAAESSPAPTTARGAAEQTQSQALQRAEWLWRLANGSLLIPVLLLIGVLIFTIREVSSIRALQTDALRPVLEYYQTVLSLRTASDQGSAPAPQRHSAGQAPTEPANASASGSAPSPDSQ